MSDMNNNIPVEIINELETLRGRVKKMKENRLKCIERNPEKYTTYFREYQKEYYHSKQINNAKYMDYQRKKALERYYRIKAEKQALKANLIVENENLVIEK